MLSDIQKNIVKKLQEDLPITKEPFKQIAEELDVSEEIILQNINYLLEKGYLRRIGAVLAHRRLGLNFNPMIVMEVDPADIDAVGERIAQIPEVTHCYNRPRLENFPYDLFAMIHCNSQEEVDSLVNKITSDDKIKSYRLLFSTKEYKKTSMKYFQ